MRMHLSLPSMLLAASAALSPAAVAQSGGAYSITSSVIAGGGATFSTGGAYSLGGTIGQPDASSAMTGGSYSLTGGFWPRVAILLKADTNGDGSINVGDVFYLINSLFAGGAPPVS